MNDTNATRYCVTQAIRGGQHVVLVENLPNRGVAEAWITANYPKALPNKYTVRSY